MAYSNLFHTVYDEKQPVGNLGRGTHYSILSAPQWLNIYQELLPKVWIQKFGIIWDEDHDNRVIEVIEKAYSEMIFYPVLFIGERKAMLTIIVNVTFFEFLQNNQKFMKSFIDKWVHICSNVGGGDVWSFNISAGFEKSFESVDEFYRFSHGSPIIHDISEKVSTYLRNINNIWSLGE